MQISEKIDWKKIMIITIKVLHADQIIVLLL